MYMYIYYGLFQSLFFKRHLHVYLFTIIYNFKPINNKQNAIKYNRRIGLRNSYNCFTGHVKYSIFKHVCSRFNY